MIRRIYSILLSSVFPQHCISCNNAGEDPVRGIACTDCWNKTRLFCDKEILCSKCGAYFGISPRPVSVECPNCNEHHYDHAFSLGIYEHALRANIISLKSNPNIRYGLKELIVTRAALFRDHDIVIPVPLSKKKAIERGFNQATLIAQAISISAAIKCDDGSLVRTKHTQIHRSGMDNKARAKTVENSFKVTRPRLIENKKILLVDDVFTSGSTASACALALKNAGSSKVDVFTLARAYIEPSI